MNPTLSHAVTFADRFGLKHLAFEVGEAAKDRQSKLVNLIRSMGDLNFWAPAATYGLAETCHAAILHFWMDSLAALLH